MMLRKLSVSFDVKVQLLQGFVIKAEFQASIFFGQFGLKNGYISQAMGTYFTAIQHCITVILGIKLELKQASRVTPSPYVLEFINAYLTIFWVHF